MNKVSKNLLGLILTTSLAQITSAQSLCNNQGLSLIFFNGVQTTEFQAYASLSELMRIHGATSPTGDPIYYELMYNHTNGYEDFVETFHTV